jgi:hypothetical protein
MTKLATYCFSLLALLAALPTPSVADCGKFSCIEIVQITQKSRTQAEVIAATTGNVEKVQMTSGGHWGVNATKIGPNLWKATFFSRPSQKKSVRTFVHGRPDAYDTE